MTELSTRELFEQGRTHSVFANKEVPDSLLNEIYDIMKFGSTSYNCCPLRITFVKSADAKAKLLPCLMEANVAKSQSAPVVALFAHDMKFYEKFTQLLPMMPNVADMFKGNEALTSATAFRNGSLQAAYFMVVARSLGLDCGPMSGFNEDKLNEAFFAGTDFKVNFICNLGYKAGDAQYPRLSRLDFTEACKVV